MKRGTANKRTITPRNGIIELSFRKKRVSVIIDCNGFQFTRYNNRNIDLISLNIYQLDSLKKTLQNRTS